jgi:NAD(P)H-dependent FMN reductase
MKRKPRILAFAGSLRKHSFNKRVLKTAIRGAENAGAEVTFIDLRDYPMPIYNPDDHEANGFDANALEFQRLLTLHDGLLIATPEHNGSFPASLKNAFEWATRPSGIYQRSDIFPGKFAAMISASPGSLGGIRSLAHLRGVLTSIGVYVLPSEIAVSFVADKFEGDGEEMIDLKMRGTLEGLGTALVQMLRKTHVEAEVASNTTS